MNIPQPAPKFSLLDQNGTTTTLETFRGKWLVLYFYPKDGTPGCTVEACSMRDSRDALAEIGAQVVGISKDTISSHQKFQKKFDLNFTLLSDEDGTVIQAYEAWGKKMFGREGILRKTFLIDPDGIVRKEYKRATPLGHGEQVIADLQSLMQK